VSTRVRSTKGGQKPWRKANKGKGFKTNSLVASRKTEGQLRRQTTRKRKPGSQDRGGTKKKKEKNIWNIGKTMNAAKNRGKEPTAEGSKDNKEGIASVDSQKEKGWVCPKHPKKK